MKTSKIIMVALLLSTLPTIRASEDREHYIFTFQTEEIGGWGTPIPTNLKNTNPTIAARTTFPSMPGGWYQSAEGFYQKWSISFYLGFKNDNVNKVTLSFWLPESISAHTFSISGSWDPIYDSNVIGHTPEVAEGWNTWTFEKPTGEYFTEENGRQEIYFSVLAPPTLPIGDYTLFKARMEATGDFEGVECFSYPGGKDTLVIQFKVGDTYDISPEESFTSHIWTNDQTGNHQDSFNVGESVYLSGEVLYIKSPHISQVPLYIVKSRDWKSYESLAGLERFGGHVIDIYDQAPFENRLIWDTPLPGSYDVIVDVDRDGVYTAGFDAVCSLRTRDFFVVPELPFGTLTALATMASVVLLRRKN